MQLFYKNSCIFVILYYSIFSGKKQSVYTHGVRNNMQSTVTMPKPAEQYLGKCYALALWSGILLVFISLLPYLAMRNNSGKLLASPGLLKAQLSATFAPLFFTAVLIIVLIFAAILQNKFFAAISAEKGQALYSGRCWKLHIPFLRYRELLEITGSDKNMKISVVCAALFWISVLILGAASPLPVYFAAVSVIFFLRYGGRAVGKKPKIAYRGLAWLLPAAFAVSASGSIYSRCSIAKLETFHREKAYRAGIPADRSELAKLLYHDRTPDKTYSAFLDSGNASAWSNTLFDARFYCALPESFRADARRTLNDSSTRKFFRMIDNAVDSGRILQYDFDLSAVHLWDPGKMPVFTRTVVQYFTGLILTSLEKRRIDDAMRYFRKLTAFQESCLNGDYLLSLTYISLFERNRASVAGYMIGSGLLTDRQLQEIAELNAGREVKLRAALLNALRTEAYFEQEWVRDMSRPYICLQSAAPGNGRSFSSPVIKALLRDAAPFPPHSWNTVLLRHTQMASFMKYESVISYFTGNVDFSVWKKEKFPGFEKMIKTNSSYFLLLNYPALVNGMESLFNGITFIRMTGAAVKIEQFRRKNNRLPENFSELGVPAPLDAVSGKKLLFSKNGIVEWTWSTNGRDTEFPIPGWVISSDGAPHLEFKVPTKWPVPAPPEITSKGKK